MKIAALLLVPTFALFSGPGFAADPQVKPNPSHEAEAPASSAKRSVADEKAAAAREADRAAGKTRTSPKTASADAENPGVGESSGNAEDVAAKAKPAKGKPAP